MLVKNGPISLVGTKVSSRSPETDGEFSVAIPRVLAFGSSWEPRVEADLGLRPLLNKSLPWDVQCIRVVCLRGKKGIIPDGPATILRNFPALHVFHSHVKSTDSECPDYRPRR